MNGLRRTLARLGDGVPVVLWRVFEWPGHGQGWRAVTGRWVWLTFLSWAGWRIVQHARPTMVLLVGCLLITAWRSGGAATAQPPTDDGPEPEPEMDDDERRARVLDLARDLIGQHRGVHIPVLLAACHTAGLLPAGATGADLRRTLDRWGVRTRDSLKVDGRVNAGLHADDLPEADTLPRTYSDGSFIVG
ncbi:MAG TPA: hypothetical protein VIS06_00050 [Mycobacteriales bacterium]